MRHNLRHIKVDNIIIYIYIIYIYKIFNLRLVWRAHMARHTLHRYQVAIMKILLEQFAEEVTETKSGAELCMLEQTNVLG